MATEFSGGGQGGREPGRIGAGGRRRKGGKRDSQIGGNREKRRKILQYCVTFYNEREPRGGNPYGRGREAGVKGTGGGSFRPLCLPPQFNSSAGKEVNMSSILYSILSGFYFF